MQYCKRIHAVGGDTFTPLPQSILQALEFLNYQVCHATAVTMQIIIVKNTFCVYIVS